MDVAWVYSFGKISGISFLSSWHKRLLGPILDTGCNTANTDSAPCITAICGKVVSSFGHCSFTHWSHAVPSGMYLLQHLVHTLHVLLGLHSLTGGDELQFQAHPAPNSHNFQPDVLAQRQSQRSQSRSAVSPRTVKFIAVSCSAVCCTARSACSAGSHITDSCNTASHSTANRSAGLAVAVAAQSMQCN